MKFWWYIVLLLVLSSCHNGSDQIDFASEVKPILNAKCMSCHGGVRQQGGLSFLFEESALAELESGKSAIVPGSVSKSEMIHRILSDDPDLMMPPEGERMTEEEIDILKLWIKQGAKWSDHWAFVPPQPVDIPKVGDTDIIENDIDRFVLAKLENENLSYSEKALKETLFRRVSFDITGLPPIYFANVDNDVSYRDFVETLLTSPHYGERWAAMWMDLARYADSQGYQKDLIRPTMWAYRDWVINAFNQDMPFDQFTIEQLAGDLLPDPDEQQLLATAFHRNTMTNDEGGTDDEEYRVAAVLDRVNTTYEVWQGLTMSCVQCHSHPYDPINHEDYYTSYAVFNNTLDSDHPQDLPLEPVLSPGILQKKEKLEKELSVLQLEKKYDSKEYIKIEKELASFTELHVPIMKELPGDTARVTRLFERGNWLVKGDTVRPHIPGFLQHEDLAISNRLDFATWLVSGDNPLTARVMVNRVWEQLFGIGLVETTEDFGTQGERPSHPELLDYLAYQFSHDYKWSVKRLIKEIVLSRTYQQSSYASDELLERDPYNRLLARGPRFRLSAEQIRDQALVASGLFNPEVYGPSVMPHQPEGVWNTIRHVARWETSSDGDAYRRGLYTFWRRVSPYPSMVSFDTPSREICVSRRIRTNTPIQALITLNDPVYVEAAEALTDLMMSEDDIAERITVGYERLLFESPDEVERNVLVELYKNVKEKHKENGLASELEIDYLSTVAVASAMFNLSEVMTKG